MNMQEAIPLAQGDVRWVFPDLDDPAVVSGGLSEADALMRRVAAHLGVRAGMTGSGLEYHRVEGVTLQGVSGMAEVSGVSFAAELGLPRRCLWGAPISALWEVEAVVMVSCEAEEDERDGDCGTEVVAEWTRSYENPAEAVRGLIQAAAWLYERCVGAEPGSWRALGMHCRHNPVG